MFNLIYGTSKLVGLLLLLYGGLLTFVPDITFLNIIGLASYYTGAYQLCVEPVDFYDEEFIV